MAKLAKSSSASTAAVQPSKGKKTTFAAPSSDNGEELASSGRGLGGDDLDDLDIDELASMSGSEGGFSGSEEEEEEDSDDDDEAPEEETMAMGRQELLESEQARQEFEASAKAARREAAQKRASAKASSSKLPPPPAAPAAPAAADYLPDELFAEAEAARAARLAKEQSEAEKQRKLEAKRALADGRAGEGASGKRRRLQGPSKIVGSAKLAVLPPTTSTTSTTTLAPAPVNPSVRKFRKRTLQTSATGPSAPLRTKMMVRGQGGKSWGRKESHLSASQGRVGPALNFAGK